MDFTIIICAYNPDDRILTRCLESVRALNRSGLAVEIILADNNSDKPLKSESYIKSFAATIPGFNIIDVKKQGVGYARRAAIEIAKGTYIVYVDADNEPRPDYLQQLQKLHKKYPQVAAWGPGNVTVEFIDDVDEKILDFAKGCFQERHETSISFESKSEWQNCYPFGTGLCMPAQLLKEYNAEADAGLLTMPGRTGKKLSSGEDTQMVLLCIREGFAAGVAPSLKLTHIINRKRANAAYIEKLIYGTFECYGTSLLQVFPEHKTQLQRRLMPPARFSRKLIKKYLRSLWRPDPIRRFTMIEFAAINAGIYNALNIPLPVVVKRIIKNLGVE